MIKKSLATFIVMFGIWSIIVEAKNVSVTQHLWQNNLATAEEFLFDVNKVDKLIVGSSLARRLPMENLHGFQNLSLSGKGIFDGLNIVKSKEKLPDTLFIEMNVLDRQENETFADTISSPLNYLKENILALRADKQPLPSTIDFVQNEIRSKGTVKSKEIVSKEKKLNSDLFDKLLEKQEIAYSIPSDDKLINKQIAILKSYVSYFKAKGVNIVFFEMPVNRKLVNLSRANQSRNKIATVFPNCDFIKLPPNINSYTTIDGVHLTEEEAQMYTNYFKSEVTELSYANN